MQELAVLASGALAAQRRFTVIADNLANINSAGFRRLRPDFQEVVSGQSRVGKNTGASYVADRGLLLDTAQGAFQRTNNPFDLAIGGDGYFAIDVNGTTQYTRRGQFVENAEGQVVTPEGYALLDNSFAPFQLPTDASQFRVASDGTLSTEQGTIGQIGVFSFAPSQLKNLVRAGGSNFVAAGGANPTVIDTPVVHQGMLESSNVNPVQEMVDMNAASQAYQNSLRLLQGLENVETNAIQTLGRTQ